MLRLWAACWSSVPEACEHTFAMTAQGSALTRYRRALARRHIFGAEIAAKEMAYLSLGDALGLLALYAAHDSPKYGKAATRWLGRLALESDDLSLHDLQLATAALQALPRRPDSALRVLTDLSRHPAPSNSGTAGRTSAMMLLGMEDRGITGNVHVLACVECPRVSSVSARGWKAYRSDDPETGEPSTLAFYCPKCADREFGWSRKV